MVRIEKRGKVYKVLIGGRASPKNFYKLKTAMKYMNKQRKIQTRLERK